MRSREPSLTRETKALGLKEDVQKEADTSLKAASPTFLDIPRTGRNE